MYIEMDGIPSGFAVEQGVGSIIPEEIRDYVISAVLNKDQIAFKCTHGGDIAMERIVTEGVNNFRIVVATLCRDCKSDLLGHGAVI